MYIFNYKCLESEPLCDTMKGSPHVKTKNIGKSDSAEECADLCLNNKKCLLWTYNKKNNNCRITKFKGNAYD